MENVGDFISTKISNIDENSADTIQEKTEHHIYWHCIRTWSMPDVHVIDEDGILLNFD